MLNEQRNLGYLVEVIAELEIDSVVFIIMSNIETNSS